MWGSSSSTTALLKNTASICSFVPLVTSSCCHSLSTQEAGLTNGTPVETSSPASVSSLFNKLQLDNDLDADGRDPYSSAETRDLFVTVDDPKKHVSTMETYITYRVSTKVRYWLVSEEPSSVYLVFMNEISKISRQVVGETEMAF